MVQNCDRTPEFVVASLERVGGNVFRWTSRCPDARRGPVGNRRRARILCKGSLRRIGGSRRHRPVSVVGRGTNPLSREGAGVFRLRRMRNKTDRNDARGIAQMMRLGWYRAAHVKNIDMQKMRSLLANRKLLKRKLIDIENHIRGALRTYGLLVGAVSRGQYEARVRELIERTDIVFSTMIETMLGVHRAIFDGYVKLHRVLLQVVQHDQICRRLMTVPGVGPLRHFRSRSGSIIRCALPGRGPSVPILA